MKCSSTILNHLWTQNLIITQTWFTLTQIMSTDMFHVIDHPMTKFQIYKEHYSTMMKVKMQVQMTHQSCLSTSLRNQKQEIKFTSWKLHMTLKLQWVFPMGPINNCSWMNNWQITAMHQGETSVQSKLGMLKTVSRKICTFNNLIWILQCLYNKILE